MGERTSLACSGTLGACFYANLKSRYDINEVFGEVKESSLGEGAIPQERYWKPSSLLAGFAPVLAPYYLFMQGLVKDLGEKELAVCLSFSDVAEFECGAQGECCRYWKVQIGRAYYE